MESVAESCPNALSPGEQVLARGDQGGREPLVSQPWQVLLAPLTQGSSAARSCGFTVLLPELRGSTGCQAAGCLLGKQTAACRCSSVSARAPEAPAPQEWESTFSDPCPSPSAPVIPTAATLVSEQRTQVAALNSGPHSPCASVVRSQEDAVTSVSDCVSFLGLPPKTRTDLLAFHSGNFSHSSGGWKSGVKVSAGPWPLWRLLGRILPPFLSSGGSKHPRLVAAPLPISARIFTWPPSLGLSPDHPLS